MYLFSFANDINEITYLKTSSLTADNYTRYWRRYTEFNISRHDVSGFSAVTSLLSPKSQESEHKQDCFGS